MSGSRWFVLGAALIGASALAAPEAEEAPDAEFLEYLGFWDGTDEDWLLFSDAAERDRDTRNDPAPDGKESMEAEDGN